MKHIQLILFASILSFGVFMAETKIVNSNGFQLRYIREGTGISVLVIGSSHYYPRIFSDTFRKNYDCIFMDHRGFVVSPGNVNISEFELNKLLEDIELIRKDSGVDKAIILGHSGHSYLALEYAKKYPQHVLGVAMIGCGPDQSDASHQAAEEYFQKLASEERKKALADNMPAMKEELRDHPEKALITMLVRLAAKSWYNYEFESTFLWKDVVVNMDLFNHVWGGIFKTIDITEGLETFDKPVFLGLGKYDFIVAPPSSWNLIIPKFKNIEMHIFEKSGHTPPYEEPMLFDQLFGNWVTKVLK